MVVISNPSSPRLGRGRASINIITILSKSFMTEVYNRSHMILPSLYFTLLSVFVGGTAINTANYAVQKAKAAVQLRQSQERLIKKGC